MQLLADLMAGRGLTPVVHRRRADRAVLPDEADTRCAVCGELLHDIPQPPDDRMIHRAAADHAAVPDRTPLDLHAKGLR